MIRVATKKIRTLVVDDSIFFREFLALAFRDDALIEIVGVAADAYDAEEKLEACKPDVIALDMEMPGMRGADFLHKIMPRYPLIKVVVISANPHNVFEALHAGAVDFIAKPGSIFGSNQADFLQEVSSKIQIAHQSRVPVLAAQKHETTAVSPLPAVSGRKDAVVAIGASTGGTEAIAGILHDLPDTMPGIVIVQHMPPVFTAMFAERLDNISPLRVREAQEGDRVEPGVALLAAGDKQMVLNRDWRGYYIQYVGSHKVSGHCPSVDVLFGSVAHVAKENAMGVILTGMGADGADGLLVMRRAGAYTVGQSRETCVVYGMPMAAHQKGAVAEQLALGAIAGDMVRWASQP